MLRVNENEFEASCFIGSATAYQVFLQDAYLIGNAHSGYFRVRGRVGDKEFGAGVFCDSSTCSLRYQVGNHTGIKTAYRVADQVRFSDTAPGFGAERRLYRLVAVERICQPDVCNGRCERSDFFCRDVVLSDNDIAVLELDGR